MTQTTLDFDRQAAPAKPTAPHLEIEQRPDGYWFAGTDDQGQQTDSGPFRTRGEAEEARRGRLRFYRHHRERGWATSGK